MREKFSPPANLSYWKTTLGRIFTYINLSEIWEKACDFFTSELDSTQYIFSFFCENSVIWKPPLHPWFQGGTCFTPQARFWIVAQRGVVAQRRWHVEGSSLKLKKRQEKKKKGHSTVFAVVAKKFRLFIGREIFFDPVYYVVLKIASLKQPNIFISDSSPYSDLKKTVFICVERGWDLMHQK